MESQLKNQVVIDFGTTRIKSATIFPSGHIDNIQSIEAPIVNCQGMIAESDPLVYRETATDLLNQIICPLLPNVSIGLACQRSSFLLWEKDTGKPITPLISWQDRRAATWCLSHQDQFSDINVDTGLLLSPHYPGPKLAYLIANDSSILKNMNAGKLLFGTLETYLIWHWTAGKFHQTDISMAARTLLVDAITGTWSEKLCQFMNIPLSILPKIEHSYGRDIPLEFGGKITSVIADQAAPALAFGESQTNKILINLGTGGFIIYPYDNVFKSKQGYLTAPIIRDGNDKILYAFEGTVNGISNELSIDTDGIGTTHSDAPFPQTFCLPDSTGIGSPYWHPKISRTYSKDINRVNDEEKNRILKEGIIFRLSQIIFDLCESTTIPPIYISGGIANDKFICQGIATMLNKRIYLVAEKELTLVGIARLVTKFRHTPTINTQGIYPNSSLEYLRSKYSKWKDWVTCFLNSNKIDHE